MSESAMTALAVCLGGASGAAVRGVVYRVVRRAATAETGLGMAWATIFVNVLGSAALGVAIAWGAALDVDDPLRLFWVTGLCGALTTFSTLCADSMHLIRNRGHRRVLVYWALNFAMGILAFAVAFEFTPG